MKKTPARLPDSEKKIKGERLSSGEMQKPLSDRPVVIGDLRDMQEKLGISLRDLYYLTASVANALPLSPQYADIRLDSMLKRVQLSLLVRVLIRCTQANYLTSPPSLDEIEPLLKRVIRLAIPKIPDEEITWAKLSVLMGTTDWSGRWWDQGATLSPMVQRLFLILDQGAKAAGKDEIAKIYKQSLDEEARARGFTGGIAEVIRNRGWHVRKKPARRAKAGNAAVSTKTPGAAAKGRPAAARQ